MAQDKQSWAHFNKFRHWPSPDGFYGVVTKEGEWVESSVSIQGAVANALMYLGTSPLDIAVDVEELQEAGISIVHSSLLQKMYEAGCLT
jgi:hypothetical protein